MRRHVLVARLDNDGDVLLAGPAIRAIAHTAGPITLLCGPRGRAAAELLPGVGRILIFRAPWIDPEPDPVDPELVAGLVAGLRALAPDEAIVLTSFHQSPLPLALVLRLAGVPRIAAISPDYPGSLLDVRHNVQGEAHEVERSLSLVARFGYKLPLDDEGLLAVERIEPSPIHPPYVVVHPGASVSARAWESERNAALVGALAAEGRRVVVTGGPGERQLTAFVAGDRGDAVIDLGGRTTLARLAGVLASADCVVAGNTGPAHLAAAVGTPVVSLFAPTVPVSSWRPWGIPHVLLGGHDIPCAGCRSRVCPIRGHPCLGVIAVDDVLEAVESFAPSMPRGRGERAYSWRSCGEDRDSLRAR